MRKTLGSLMSFKDIFKLRLSMAKGPGLVVRNLNVGAGWLDLMWEKFDN